MFLCVPRLQGCGWGSDCCPPLTFRDVGGGLIAAAAPPPLTSRDVGGGLIAPVPLHLQGVWVEV